jgi:hypothetical protein
MRRVKLAGPPSGVADANVVVSSQSAYCCFLAFARRRFLVERGLKGSTGFWYRAKLFSS